MLSAHDDQKKSFSAVRSSSRLLLSSVLINAKNVHTHMVIDTSTTSRSEQIYVNTISERTIPRKGDDGDDDLLR